MDACCYIAHVWVSVFSFGRSVKYCYCKNPTLVGEFMCLTLSSFIFYIIVDISQTLQCLICLELLIVGTDYHFGSVVLSYKNKRIRKRSIYKLKSYGQRWIENIGSKIKHPFLLNNRLKRTYIFIYCYVNWFFQRKLNWSSITIRG